MATSRKLDPAPQSRDAAAMQEVFERNSEDLRDWKFDVRCRLGYGEARVPLPHCDKSIGELSQPPKETLGFSLSLCNQEVSEESMDQDWALLVGSDEAESGGLFNAF